MGTISLSIPYPAPQETRILTALKTHFRMPGDVEPTTPELVTLIEADAANRLKEIVGAVERDAAAKDARDNVTIG
jgi:hypothetical protein